jgi:formylglycine-generating enzyme required for sulfatase activity
LAQQRELEREKKARRGWQWLAVVLGAIATGTVGSFAFHEGLRWIAIWQTEMVSIEGGYTTIGTNIADAYDEEKPEWRPYIPAFKIQKFEVSNGQYRLCVWAGHCDKPVNPIQLDINKFSKHPVVEVTAFHAASYCEWLGMRLPMRIIFQIGT